MRPASAACTLFRILSSPVNLFTATRKPCTLKATDRGEPDELPLALSTLPCDCADAASSAKGVRRPAQTAAWLSSEHASGFSPGNDAANVLSCSANASAAACVARPATKTTALP